jgi:transcriptional regulator with XRE-family HTH domain
MTVHLGRAIEADEIIRALKGYGFTQADIATAAGVSTRSVRNWHREAVLRRKNEEQLHVLREIVLLLNDSLTPRGVGQWFRARNRILKGRRPLDVLAAGNVERVRQAAEAFADGAYV